MGTDEKQKSLNSGLMPGIVDYHQLPPQLSSGWMGLLIMLDNLKFLPASDPASSFLESFKNTRKSKQ